MLSSHDLLQDLSCDEPEFGGEDPLRLKLAERVALAANRWFAGLGVPIRHDLLRAIRVRPCAPGEEIFAAGAPADAWMVCLAGAVRVATPMRNGRSLTLGFLGPGEWFGDLRTTATPRHMHRAIAKGAIRIGQVERRAAGALLRKHPEFHAALLGWQSMRVASLVRLLEEHTTVNMPARIARQVFRLARDHGQENGQGEIRITLQFSQSELADLAGCSRQRANHQLVKLVHQGVVRYEAGNYIVTDRSRLQELCRIDLLDTAEQQWQW